MARRLGITPGRMSQLVSGQDWPFPRAPWSDATADLIEAHHAARRAGNNATAGAMEDTATDDAIQALSKNPERVARIKLLIERTAKLKLERELLAGGYVKREDAERERTARVYSVRAKLQEIPLRASLIAHKSEAECERVLSDWAREVCDYYANGGN
jgi:hypothetical protein